MNTIKIISNPYDMNITYLRKNGENWEDINDTNPNSSLLSKKFSSGVFPFIIQEVLDRIIEEYKEDAEKIEIIFEGSSDEFNDFKKVCMDGEYSDSVIFTKSDRYLENARDILPNINELYQKRIAPIIFENAAHNPEVKSLLDKYSDASQATIPLCVLGNYSSGKSTFINALVGGELLPSGDEPVTARIYQITKSKQADRAKVTFGYCDKDIILSFDGVAYHIDTKLSEDNKVLMDLKGILKENESANIFKRVNNVLSYLNAFVNDSSEEKDDVSDLIKIEIPFSDGILGRASSSFVIFDTPGSNSASNNKHFAVLKEAMKNLSNGLPIYVSTFDALDSTDNESLYKEINSINELDSRFTMIVVNKADKAELPEEGFSKEREARILRMSVPKNLYSEGIYFVSSVVGLASKVKGKFDNRYYAGIFYDIEQKFTNKEHPFYNRLYAYNIMPEHLKSHMLEDSEAEEILLYSNSGLRAVENELQIFADKYSPYNKCKQSYRFLRSAIDDTLADIELKRDNLEFCRNELTEKLGVQKQDLIKRLKIAKQSFERPLSESFSKEMLTRANTIFQEYSKTTNDFKEKYDKELENTRQDFKVSEKRSELSEYQNDVKNNVRVIMSQGETANAVKKIISAEKEYAEVNKSAKSKAAEKLIEATISSYNNKVSTAICDLDTVSKVYWSERIPEVKKTFLAIVTGNESLSADEKQELRDVIIDYANVEFTKSGVEIFKKSDFEKKRILFLGRVSDEINLRKVCRKYNNELKNAILIINRNTTNNHYDNFKEWLENLMNVILEKLAEYNPVLRRQTDIIREQTKDIFHLIQAKDLLTEYEEGIQTMLDWKEN